MSNIIEMVPAHALDESLQAVVLGCAGRIRNNKVTLRKAAMAIGYDGAVIDSLAERGSWTFLGFHNQHDFRIAEGIGRSNWYRVVGVASKFLTIDREVYVAMSMENAERLSIEPPEIRLDPTVLQLAAEMTAEKFDDEMTTRGAHRDGRPKREHWVQVKWLMRVEQRKVIELALASWKEEHGIEDDVFALETMLAEIHSRPTLVGFLLQSRSDLVEQIKTSDDLAQLKLYVANYVIGIQKQIDLCCGETEEERSA
jgi:hypothetical protein